MILFSVGLPSPFAEWCDAIAKRLTERALGPAEALHANTLEQFALAVMTMGSPYLVVSSRQIVGRLQTLLAEANRRLIVTLDAPRLALEHLVVRNGIELLEATRGVASSCASMLSCAALPGALVLHADQADANPCSTAQAIARQFEIDVSETDLADIVASLANLGISPHRQTPNTWWDELEEPQRALAAGALDPYVARFARGDLAPIIWERQLFFINEEQPRQQRLVASRPVDITGSPRILVYGPYITLPPGSWSATVTLGFSQEAAEMSYIVDIYAGKPLTQLRLHPDRRRFVEANLDFSIPDPLDDPIEVRVWNERAAFDGRLALGHVTLTPHGSMRPETRKYLETALGE